MKSCLFSHLLADNFLLSMHTSWWGVLFYVLFLGLSHPTCLSLCPILLSTGLLEGSELNSAPWSHSQHEQSNSSSPAHVQTWISTSLTIDTHRTLAACWLLRCLNQHFWLWEEGSGGIDLLLFNCLAYQIVGETGIKCASLLPENSNMFGIKL